MPILTKTQNGRGGKNLVIIDFQRPPLPSACNIPISNTLLSHLMEGAQPSKNVVPVGIEVTSAGSELSDFG